MGKVMRHTLGPLLEDKLCLIFKLAPSVCRMTFPILASLLVRLVVLLPFQLLRLSLATPSRWTPLALSVFLHCVVRSEERFSRNAETDLVCRLLLEKKKKPTTKPGGSTATFAPLSLQPSRRSSCRRPWPSV